MKKALIFYGGWAGHEPGPVTALFAGMLEEAGVQAERYDSMDCLADGEKLKTYDLIIPHWTMGQIPGAYAANVMHAVEEGTGLAGCHGGMCDAFRENVEWQFMTGGQWVAHPGEDLTYTVRITAPEHPITAGIGDFSLTSEQYYLHVDPVNTVLATTRFPTAPGPHAANGPVDMPVIWTRRWGMGNVFYFSVGHDAALFADCPEAAEIMRRGMLWALR